MKKLILLVSIAALGCKSGNDKSEDKKTPSIPELKNNAPVMNFDKNSVKPDSKSIAGAKIKDGEPLNCSNICNHLAFCDHEVNMKSVSSSSLNTCIRTCDHDKSPTGVAKFDAFRKCIGKHRNSQCSTLKKCLKDEFSSARTKLHGKDAVKK